MPEGAARERQGSACKEQTEAIVKFELIYD